mmetsp:Transcript_16135/g.27530  ORF Transcript_16135/g.27530 Transcript_16135/m.27530 type:complete len:108 (-) Transcript_16135:324-647(-)
MFNKRIDIQNKLQITSRRLLRKRTSSLSILLALIRTRFRFILVVEFSCLSIKYSFAVVKPRFLLLLNKHEMWTIGENNYGPNSNLEQTKQITKKQKQKNKYKKWETY